MEPIKIRYSLFYPGGGTIGYVYGREGLKQLELEEEAYDGSCLIKIGSQFVYNGEKFEVKEVRHMIYKELQTIDTSFGVNIHSNQDPDGYSFDAAIIIVADNI